MHVNQSLFKDGKNVFFDKDGERELSTIAYNYLAGILNHAKGFCAITNPTVNSYKRLVSGYEAPVYIAWALTNRSPLVRVPAKRGASTRLELRNPDPSCNPYLALAVILESGLDGIKKKLNPPHPVDKNIYELDEEKRRQLSIDSLPESIAEAIDYLNKDELIKKSIGSHACKIYMEAKKLEWDEYKNKITPWEIEQYLTKF